MSSSPANWEPPLPEELQLLLPQYEITGILGRGGMGAVYKGRQAKLDRPVAIKLLPEILSGDDESMNFVKRFEQEARAMANLDHPAIISVYDFGETSQGQFYFVMEFVDGMDIHQYLQHHGGKIPQEHALSITAHVLDALAYAHSRGIVHRDIKPANILLNRDGKIKIADFGLAKKFGAGADDNAPALTMSNVAVGTPDYVAPEALEKGTTTDHRADLYAVGVMLYQMLTGKLPRGMIRLPSELDPEIDPRLDQVISKALEADPDRRYQDAAAIRVDLDAVSSRPMTKIQAGVSSRAVPAAVPATPTIQHGGKPQVSRQTQGWQAPKSQTRTKGEGAPRKSSATKLYSGIGVAAVVLIGVLVMMMGGGDKPGTEDAPPLAAVEDTGVPPQVEPPPTPPLAPQPAPQPGPEPPPEPQEPTPPTPAPPAPPEPQPEPPGGQPRSPLQDLPPSPAQQRLAALEAEIRTAHSAAVEVPFNEKRAELEGKFRGAVERTITTAEEPLKRKLEADLGRLDSGEELPGADVDQEFPLLVRLRATWHQEFARIEDARQAIEKEFWVPWQAALGELEQEFTSSGEAAPAAATFALRQQLHTEFTGEAAPEAPAPPAEVANPGVEQPPSHPAPPQGESFVLFDGRSLDGWTATGSPRVFTVDRDTIKATGGVGHLIYSADVHHGRRFRDFDFKARVKTEDEAVAGIFFHVASAGETALNEGIGVQIHNGTNPNKTGGIISMPPHDKLTVADGEWFDLEISVRRNLVTTRVNGEIVLERQGEGALEGTFALHCGLSERGTTWFQGLEVQTYLDPLTALCTVPQGEAFQREFPDYERMPSGTIHRFGFGENGDPLDGKMPTNRDFVAVVTAGDHWAGLRSNATVRSSNPEWENSRNRIGRLFWTWDRIGLVKNDGSPLHAERDLVSRSRWHLDGERLYDWALGYNSNLALGIDGRVDGDFYNPGKDPGVLMPPIGPTDIIDLSVIGASYYGLRSNGRMVLIGVREGPDVPEIPAEAKIVEISEGSFGDVPHILALADNGEVFVIGGGDDAWGKNGIPEGLRARKVRTGRGISAAQREDGTWVAWGDNRHGIVTKINGFGPKVIDLAPDLRSVSWIEEN